MEFKFVISDPKTGKSYQKALNNDWFIGKKIGDKVDGNLLGLKNFELAITGGSDKAGFPMRKGVDLAGRKKVLSGKGTGVRVEGKGTRIRKTVRGSIISDQIAQINLKIEKHGSENIETLLGVKKEEPKPAA